MIESSNLNAKPWKNLMIGEMLYYVQLKNQRGLIISLAWIDIKSTLTMMYILKFGSIWESLNNLLMISLIQVTSSYVAKRKTSFMTFVYSLNLVITLTIKKKYTYYVSILKAKKEYIYENGMIFVYLLIKRSNMSISGIYSARETEIFFKDH